METRLININQIDQNKGQIEGLPANPRQWTRDDVERLAWSIDETPELLDARPLIAIPHGGKHVVLGGNLRLAALKKLGRKEAPVYVLPEDTPPDKLREIVDLPRDFFECKKVELRFRLIEMLRKKIERWEGSRI